MCFKKKSLITFKKKVIIFDVQLTICLSLTLSFSINQVSFKEKMEAVLAQLTINWLILHSK